jgi:4-amino-4-deoxy-L-arabinose transferase-like glycosyltransferase
LPNDRRNLALRLAALTAILAGAVFLRLLGFTWGLPGSSHLLSYHPDEYHSLRGFFALLTSDLNPHFFNYGSLYLYLVSLFILLLHPGTSLVAWLQGFLFGDAGTLLRTWTLDARLATLVCGLLSVYLSYLLGRRLWGERAGLLSAALLAILPLHVLLSHYATVDVTQTLFILLALCLAAELVEKPSWRGFAWAGAAAGLAASTKYNGAVVIVAPLLSAMLAASPRPRAETLARRWGLIAAAALLAFLVTSPYTALAWPEAREGIAFELQHMRAGESLAVQADPSGFLFHTQQLLAPGMGLLFVLGLIGAAATVARRDRRCYPLVLFGLLWLVIIGLARVRYPRYELPLAALLVPLALAPLAYWPRGRRVWSVLLGLAAALMLLWSVQVGVAMRRPDPREQALAFVAGLPAGAVGLVDQPWFADPPLDYCNCGRGLAHNPVLSQHQHRPRPLVITGPDAEALGLARPGLFVTTDFSVGDGLLGGDPETVAFMAALEKSYRPAAQFGGVPLALVPWRLGPDWRYPWPRITVWQRND